MSKPLKIKLKDHHADDERFACVKTIVEHYEISMKDAKIIMDEHWHLHETFADMLIAKLDAIYKKKVEIKTSFTKEDMKKAFDAGTYFGNCFIEASFENLKELNPTIEDFDTWLKSYKNLK